MNHLPHRNEGGPRSHKRTDQASEVLTVGYPYTGRGKLLNKLTAKDHQKWSLEETADFIRE